MVRNVAIVEDNAAEATIFQDYLVQYGDEAGLAFNVTHFTNAEDFLDKYRPVYDIVFMDICLPSANGMEAAALLRGVDQTTMLIFVTNMAQFAIKGYEVDAFDFVVKPVSYANFALKLQRALSKLGSTRGTEVVVSTSRGLTRIDSTQIKYIEISGHKMAYHTTGGQVNAYGNLKEVEQLLSDKGFARCNSCYLVNMNFVRAIRGYIVVVDEDELQISRPKKKSFMAAVNDYLGGGI